MSYQVIARRFRPQTFEDVVGQKHVTQTLVNAIRAGKIAHAFLFTGERGVGKTSVARILAKALNCEHGPTDQPCDQCPSCLDIKRGSSIDVQEIDGASNTSVDDIRTLRENVKYRPSRDRYKIYIIDEVHMLSKAAFNALLKTLEEPPSHVIFVFATTEPHKIPDTIISRCLRFDFRRIPVKQIAEQLQMIAAKDNISITDRSLHLIAMAAEGSMRDAQSLLDRIISYSREEISDRQVEEMLGWIDRRLIYQVTEAVIAENARGCLDALDTIYNAGIDLRQFYYIFLEHLRDLVVVKISRDSSSYTELPEAEFSKARELASKVSLDDLQQYFRMWFALEQDFNRSSLPKVVLEIGLVEMAAIKHMLPLDTVLEKLDNLERTIGGEGTGERIDKAVQKEKQPMHFDKDALYKNTTFSKSTKVAMEDNMGTSIVPAKDDSAQVNGEFLNYIRKKNISIASVLEQGKMYLHGNNCLVIELPAVSFYMDRVNDTKVKKSLQQMCNEFFNQKMKIDIITDKVKNLQKSKSKNNREQIRQEVLKKPIIKKIVETFDGKIIEVKTDF